MELRLVLEYCDAGSLRDALDQVRGHCGGRRGGGIPEHVFEDDTVDAGCVVDSEVTLRVLVPSALHEPIGDWIRLVSVMANRLNNLSPGLWPCIAIPKPPSGLPLQGAFTSGGRGELNYRAVLETALDVAKGMMHLHSLDLVHSDLKVLPGDGGKWNLGRGGKGWSEDTKVCL